MQLGQIIPILVLSLFAMWGAFWVFWALTGWGVSIAVRVYRRRMARHELAVPACGQAGRSLDSQAAAVR